MSTAAVLTPSSSAPPTTPPLVPTPAPVSNVEIGLDGLHLGGTGRAPSLLATDDVAGTLAALRALFGGPTVASSSPGDHCILPATTYDWQGALILAVVDGEDIYDTRILKASAAGANGVQVSLTGPSGVRVGDDISSTIASTPATRKESYEAEGTTNWTLLLDSGHAGKDAAQGLSGTAAFTRGTVVTAIGAPVPVHSRQDC